MAIPNPDNNKPQWTPELWLQRFKEIVTAILGVAIVAFTLILAALAFGVLSRGETLDKDRIAAAKDILLLVLGLSGVVIGYYFGRVPADAKAAQAQQQANAATSQAEKISAQAHSVAEEIDRFLDTASKSATEAVARGAAPAAAVPSLSADELRRMRDKLRNVGSR